MSVSTSACVADPAKQLFQAVQDSDEFLALFPHRFDYIWAEHPNPDVAVNWKTESRHPLSDRLIQQGAYLYGVRFGAQTNYCVLDVDVSSLYHPKHDPLAISRICAALEPLGLVRRIACTSSYSGGLHLYFPFQHTQSSWQLAIALSCLLENAGFKLQPGQLEVFPNPKPYALDGNFSLFNAHRLPLQTGSYLLNDGLQPVLSTSQQWVRSWKIAQFDNDIDPKTLKQILKHAKRKHFGISGKAEKFVNDLNAEIELGWTGTGQTNRLLGRITMRSYIFHHVLSGGDPLEGNALVKEIVEVARSLPGYTDWCRHQHEIEHRAAEWAHCIENSHYFHFGHHPQFLKPPQDSELAAAVEQAPSWNQRQSAATRDRIRRAIASLLETNSLPIGATARFQVLLKFGIGGASLYRHRDLWHPKYMSVDSIPISVDPIADCLDKLDCSSDYSDELEITAQDATDLSHDRNRNFIQVDSQLDCANGASNCQSLTSLLPNGGGNALWSRGLQDFSASPTSAGGENIFLSNTLTYKEKLHISVSEHQRVKAEAAEQRQMARMQQFLASDDPILMAEAITWVSGNLELLNGLNRASEI
jgi:hypothetical protein